MLIVYRGGRSLSHTKLGRRRDDPPVYRPLGDPRGPGKRTLLFLGYSSSSVLQKLGMITFRRQLQTSETVEYTLLKFHDKKDYLRFLKTLSEIRTYYYTSFSA